MQLPLADDIRDARRLTEESHQAVTHLDKVRQALDLVRILEGEAIRFGNIDVELPGDPLIPELSERWPALSDLPASQPHTGQALLTRLQLRRGQLDMAAQVLRPIAGEFEQRSATLSRLQHQQRHQLDDARWSDAVAELVALGAERDRVQAKVGPLRQQLTVLDPAARVLLVFHDHVDQELRLARAADPDGRLAWRAATVAEQLARSADALAQQLALALPSPPSVSVPPMPDPLARERLLAEAEAVLAAIARSAQDVAARADAIRPEAERLSERYEQLTRQILDRMG